MKCSEALELVPLYRAGGLGASEAAAVSKHLNDCTDCARALAWETDFDARLRTAILAQPAFSQALDRRVLQLIALDPGPPRSLPRWTLAAAGVAALLLAGIAGFRTAFPLRTGTGMYAQAARDHQVEVIDRQPRKWQSDPASILELAARHGISGRLIRALPPSGYRLDEGRLCKVGDRVVLHLVYRGVHRGFDPNARSDFSVFVGQTAERSGSGTIIHSASRGKQHVAGFEDGNMTIVVVTNQPGEAATRLAHFFANNV